MILAYVQHEYTVNTSNGVRLQFRSEDLLDGPLQDHRVLCSRCWTQVYSVIGTDTRDALGVWRFQWIHNVDHRGGGQTTGSSRGCASSTINSVHSSLQLPDLLTYTERNIHYRGNCTSTSYVSWSRLVLRHDVPSAMRPQRSPSRRRRPIIDARSHFHHEQQEQNPSPVPSDSSLRISVKTLEYESVSKTRSIKSASSLLKELMFVTA